MNKNSTALFGGLFFSYIIIKKLSNAGLSYLQIELLIVVIAVIGYLYKKYHWLIEEKN